MKKDVIYIDIEDDITAIIGKVKAASAKVVALVPPKRVGVLQSAVNLKLLQRTATGSDRRVVLITNDQSLISLAAGVKMPVARNLQSKPEIPSIPALQVNDSDIINGEELPVGDIAAAAGTLQKPEETPSDADAISDKVDFATLNDKPSDKTLKKKKSGIKIPNFDTFRKKLFFIGGGVLVLILFLIWALVIAPTATITINAKTSAVNIDRQLSLESGLSQSEANQLKLKPEVQQIKKATSEEFDATGTKDIGEKASGKVTLRNAFASEAITVPAGTLFTAASGQKFSSSAATTVPGAKVVGGGIQPGTSSVTVVAADIGPEYNVAAQGYIVQGYNNLSASGDAMGGGTREKVTIVSDEDVAKAKEKLAKQDVSGVKNDLKAQFKGDFIIIDESYLAEAGAPAVAPRVGEQARKAKLTIETTYTLLGLPRKDVKQVLDDVLKDALDDKPNQSIFSSGDNTVQFQNFTKVSDGIYKTQLVTTGYIGASIDTKKLAEDLKGKRYGEIEQVANQISGVNKVDVQFSPFWVTSAPQDANKITIKFTVVNEAK